MAWLSRKTAGSDYVDLADLDSREIVDDPAEGATKADLWQHLKWGVSIRSLAVAYVVLISEGIQPGTDPSSLGVY